MVLDPDLATVAALIGEPTRASMLLGLMDGRAQTASELAAEAGVASSTASEHLGQLVDGGLLVREAQGRHRYYRLASPRVARLLESLGTIARPAQPKSELDKGIVRELRFARTCYDHLAGWLGVAVLGALCERGLLIEHDGSFQLTSDGERWFQELGVDLARTRRARRAFARRCLDWTERRAHLAGSLGAELLDRLLERGWISRVKGERALELTRDGATGLRAKLGIAF